jgi:tetratricopeptide (TPR) repeat protein
MTLQERNRKSNALARRAIFLILSTLLALAFLGAAGCRPKVVRIKLTTEDLVKSNAAAAEGDIAFTRKEYYPALVKYLKAADYNPNSEFIFNKLGIVYSRLKYYADAITSFNRAIALQPKYAYAYNNLGSVYFAENNKKKAEKLFRKALSLYGNEASFYINLGTVLFEKKKFDQGLQEYKKGLALDPEILRKNADAVVANIGTKISPDKNYHMARLYAILGDTERAVETLKQAITDGFVDLKAIQTEKDFDPIREDPKFVDFMKYASTLINTP